MNAYEMVAADFQSRNLVECADSETLPGRDRSSRALLSHYLNTTAAGTLARNLLRVSDSEIDENIRFTYPVLHPKGTSRSGSVIILFHGLNEKRWDKYLPWAQALAGMTGKSVLLFPLAFHMNRAPAEWADPRLMQRIVRERKELFPGVLHSSFANAALSHRIQFAPERFLRSGVQSYLDAVQLVREIRSGSHPEVREDASVDLFGYSIGAFLAEMLVMADPGGLFTPSRLVMFCGGSVLNRAQPVSRAIIDSEAAHAMQRYLEALPAAEGPGSGLGIIAADFTPREQAIFLSMIHADKYRSVRRRCLSALTGRIKAITLAGDRVFPPDAVAGTLREHGIDTKVFDFPFRYSHENPFPAAGGPVPGPVRESMMQVCEETAAMYRN
ncbi:hypothetical protein JXO52_02745 [bacterium]|nr:hypothetical protein [bacterium]